MQRRRLGALGLFLGDGARFHHRVQHQIPALDRSVRMAERIEVVRPLQNPGKHRALGQVKLMHVFAEVSLRCLAESVDGKAAALSEIHLVRVHFKNLLLVVAMFEMKGDGDLDHLALEAFLRREKEVLRQLHGQRRSSLLLSPRRYVAINGFKKPPVIHAAMLEESSILNRHHRLHKIGRNLFVGNEPAFRAIFIFAQAGNQQRLELIAGQALPVVVADGLNDSAIDGDRCAILRMVRLRPRVHRNRTNALRIGPKFRAMRCTFVCITGFTQLVGDQANGKLLPRPNFPRRCINLGSVRKNRLFETVIDNALVLVIEVAENTQAGENTRNNNYSNYEQKQRQPTLRALWPCESDF